MPLVESAAMTHRASTYIDITVVNAVLAGLVVLIGALWALYGMSRLWQQSLYREASGALAAAADLGFAVQPASTGPRLVARGAIQGQPVRVEWRGGVWGAHSVVVWDGQRTVVPLLTDADSFLTSVELSQLSELP